MGNYTRLLNSQPVINTTHEVYAKRLCLEPLDSPYYRTEGDILDIGVSADASRVNKRAADTQDILTFKRLIINITDFYDCEFSCKNRCFTK